MPSFFVLRSFFMSIVYFRLVVVSLAVSTSVINCLKRLVFEMICCVSSGTLICTVFTHSLTYLLTYLLCLWLVVWRLALINEVNQRRARLVLRWVTVSGFNSRCRTFISVYNQPATQGQLSHPSLRGR